MLNIWSDKLNPKDSHVNRYELVIKNDPNGGIFFLLWRHGFRYMAFDVFTFKSLSGSWSCWYWFIYQYSIPWDYAEYLERQIESEGFTC